MTIYDNYKILQAISGRMETIEDNVNSLVDVVSKIRRVFVCKSPRVPNSRQYTEDREYPIGFEVIIQCNYGYETTKYVTNKMTCVGNGLWSENVTCNLIDCGEPPDVYHGSFYDGYSTTVNTVLTVTCHNGFEIVGAEPFYCNEFGQWVGQQLCMRRVCVPAGDNTTECFFNYDNFVFDHGMEVGEVTAKDDEACLTKCLRIHEHVAFIEQFLIFCTCYNRTNREMVLRSPGRKTFIREREISLLEYV
ncbi:biological adhesion [Mactra antiquata]